MRLLSSFSLPMFFMNWRCSCTPWNSASTCVTVTILHVRLVTSYQVPTGHNWSQLVTLSRSVTSAWVRSFFFDDVLLPAVLFPSSCRGFSLKYWPGRKKKNVITKVINGYFEYYDLCQEKDKSVTQCDFVTSPK